MKTKRFRFENYVGRNMDELFADMPDWWRSSSSEAGWIRFIHMCARIAAEVSYDGSGTITNVFIDY